MGKQATATVGDNSTHVIAKDELKSLVDRLERLNEEKQAIVDDFKDVMTEARSRGYDTKALRTILRMRKQDADERREREALIEIYAEALGMLASLPLGKAAIERATARVRQPSVLPPIPEV